LNAAQCQRVAGDGEAGDDALADAGGLRGRAAPDRFEMCTSIRKAHLRDRCHQRRVAGAERSRVEDRRVDAAIVRLIQLVDDLALDIGVEDLNLEPSSAA